MQGAQRGATLTQSMLAIARRQALRPDFLVALNTASMLEDLVHEVGEVHSGTMALEELRADGFDLMITDQAMPQMTGIQLIDAARQSHPSLPVILATGYAELPAGADPSIPRLSKPFFQADLEKALTQIGPRAGCPRRAVPPLFPHDPPLRRIRPPARRPRRAHRRPDPHPLRQSARQCLPRDLRIRRTPAETTLSRDRADPRRRRHRRYRQVSALERRCPPPRQDLWRHRPLQLAPRRGRGRRRLDHRSIRRRGQGRQGLWPRLV